MGLEGGDDDGIVNDDNEDNINVDQAYKTRNKSYTEYKNTDDNNIKESKSEMKSTLAPIRIPILEYIDQQKKLWSDDSDDDVCRGKQKYHLSDKG